MEVKISGAGPAGSVAAVAALRKGHSVEIFEEHDRSGHPQHCSGLISKEGLESLMDIADYNEFVINGINGAVFDFAGERFEIKRGSETASVIDRARFDDALAQRAAEEGAKINYGKRFVPRGDEDAIIGADGALSATAHHFNFPKIRTFAHTLKSKARLEIEEPQKVHLFYDNNHFPGFFGWLIPHSEEEAEIGMGTTNPARMRAGFEFLLKKLQPSIYSKPKGKIIPLELRRKISGKFGKTNVLLAGDAAGQVKAYSGGGVVFGTAGARLAGAYAAHPEKYGEKFRKENGTDLLAHKFLRNFFALQPNLGLRFTSLASKLVGLDKFFASYGSMDRPTRLFAKSRAQNEEDDSLSLWSVKE